MPADTPDNKIEEVGREKMLKKLERSNLEVAFVGLYYVADGD